MLRSFAFATLLLAATTAFFVPAASAADCDGDPVYWHTEEPTYDVCKAVVEGDCSYLERRWGPTVASVVRIACGGAGGAVDEVMMWWDCLRGVGPCPA